jgi:type 1 glutamine amidotransferase
MKPRFFRHSFLFRLVHLLLIQFILIAGLAVAQPKILHFTKTSGFDHQTRTASLAMFQQLAASHQFQVVDDNSAMNFTDLSNLLSFDLIVFSNTSGNAILNQQQQQNVEQFIAAGKPVLGIHAATDTYRHSSANGSNTGAWDFYAELMGGSVRESPNHVNGTPVYAISHLMNHPLLNQIPNPWHKAEEYYYWESGYLNPNNQHLLQVEATLGPNGQLNSYDSARTVAWYRIHSSGSKVFYTSLGHDVSNFTSDSLFYRLIGNAVQWLMEDVLSVPHQASSSLRVYPNPFENIIHISSTNQSRIHEVRLTDASGIIKHEWNPHTSGISLMTDLASGWYFLQVISEKEISYHPLIKR